MGYRRRQPSMTSWSGWGSLYSAVSHAYSLLLLRTTSDPYGDGDGGGGDDEGCGFGRGSCCRMTSCDSYEWTRELLASS